MKTYCLPIFAHREHWLLFIFSLTSEIGSTMILSISR